MIEKRFVGGERKRGPRGNHPMSLLGLVTPSNPYSTNALPASRKPCKVRLSD